jgi:murein DD-endopeptidase MepM/ murein hydrolase activator NlpD
MLARVVRPRGRARHSVIATALLGALGALAIASLMPAAALGDDPGGGGGAAPGLAPVVGSAHCLRACPGIDSAGPGSLVRVSGRELAGTRTVVFLGGKGARDDVSAAARRVRATVVDAIVPERARTGPVLVVASDAQESTPTRRPLEVTPADGPRAPRPLRNPPWLDARVQSKQVFFGGRRRASLLYLVKGSTPQDARVDLVRVSDQRSIAHWIARDIEPGVTQTVSWNGLTGRRVAPAGRYEFRIAVGPQPVESTRVARRASTQLPPTPDDAPPAGARAGSFAYLAAMFPIRGRHDYGGASGRFGAGRAGHTHQGQDVFAPCGTPLVAARGGRVKWRASQALAGNYLVIDAAGTGIDMAYMHLREPGLVKRNAHVYTGQVIGHVGDTGDAVGCHLHFELWSAPGWYSGGSPFDPLPTLRAWDRVS